MYRVHTIYTNMTINMVSTFLWQETSTIQRIVKLIGFWDCHVIVHKVLFTNPSARAGYDTRSIFKLSLTGLNSEFSFS